MFGDLGEDAAGPSIARLREGAIRDNSAGPGRLRVRRYERAINRRQPRKANASRLNPASGRVSLAPQHY